jgi:hypothetical protein
MNWEALINGLAFLMIGALVLGAFYFVARVLIACEQIDKIHHKLFPPK